MSTFDTSTANLLSACDARKAIDEGHLSSQELVKACFDRIDSLEESIGAWTHLDREVAMQQAREADEFRSRGLRVGALHGIPIGIKDIIDTSDYATELGTVLHKGRRPSSDATLVSLLKEAGAIILGKTVTTELAALSPGKTSNPHNNGHTPGGSSSGSAAAVASAMVPLAVGTQTNGSVIRPASFCGVYGFKPSFGRISRQGVLKQSARLDTVGVFARCLEDLALIADVVMRYDQQDDAMTPIAPPCISSIMTEPVPVDPIFAFIRTPAWDKTEQVTKDGFRELIETINESKAKTIDIFDLPAQFDNIFEDHRIVMEADIARNFDEEFTRGKAELSEELRSMIERGQKITNDEYNGSVASIADYTSSLDEVFELYDAILTPATPGPAPLGLHSTGDPAMNTIWTFCGTPTLNLPLLQSEEGLPLGVQLVGEKDDDARLFRSARWLLDSLNDL